ncbi:tRNA(Ile)-lysidine synthetase [Alicyclobacillus acidocaldarius subsp. acidocaldarius DSM 446]|uniref:tRNA(Ile)-lysidine synthase n=1 Tax=Alicyclobacillus acidocaldarius subsp. acidocaldarius (strain ATCC 27009 / DSM 446 / BCRC 14685 / JCM 5260 / KCTC 1825 / NBRC 15652 / NCIMB 11725 / NRRL B-14509 / 104-IA) TaxID=521098 RepID=C8WQT3_ALIAD|nr:tRNA(Ile)-lysidine synthetase [Alicyclobacillus acidocaldarius subsp. acidocaldarius DSM 446]
MGRAHNLLTHVISFFQQHRLETAHAVLGVSGGVDSMVLLHLCQRAAEEAPSALGGFSVVHVHHHLRETADRDAAFVERYCREREIPCEIAHVKVVDERGEGLEAAARRARYQALADRARVKGGVILVAHHAQDELETFIMRLLRGAGPGGLGAMRPEAEMNGVRVLRPLLAVEKSEIERYAALHGVPHVEDETNEDPRFFRNRVRQVVIPALRAVEPRAEEKVRQALELLWAEDAYMRELACEAARRVAVCGADGRIAFSASRLGELHVSLQRRVIHILLNCFSAREWTLAHVEAVRRLALSGPPSGEVHLAADVRCVRSYDNLYIGHPPIARPAVETAVAWDLHSAAEVLVGEGEVRWRFRRLRVAHPASARMPSPWWLLLPADVSRAEIAMGVPTSERVPLFGGHGTKKLQDVFTDAKLPRAWRARWPLLRVDGDIVWIPGIMRSGAHLWGGGPAFVIRARPPAACQRALGER